MKKCVIILDESLPLGLLANAPAVLAMTIRKQVNNIIGANIKDASNQLHIGITNTSTTSTKNRQREVIINL